MSGNGFEATASGERAMAMLDALGAISDAPDNLTRLYLSPAHRRAAEQVRAWMEEAGCAAHIDAVGNVVGRYGPADGPVLYCGSHIDTVIDAGRFDGSLGVVAAILAVGELARRGIALPFAIEILAFGDEENVRFPTSLSSTQAIAGGYDPRWLEVCDDDCVSPLAQALRDFGGDPAADRAGSPAIRRRRWAISNCISNRGPVLERADLPSESSQPSLPPIGRIALLRGEAGQAARCRWGCAGMRWRERRNDRGDRSHRRAP